MNFKYFKKTASPWTRLVCLPEKHKAAEEFLKGLDRTTYRYKRANYHSYYYLYFKNDEDAIALMLKTGIVHG